MAGMFGGGSSSPPPKPKESGDAITVTPGPVSNTGADAADAQKRAALSGVGVKTTSLLGDDEGTTAVGEGINKKTWG